MTKTLIAGLATITVAATALMGTGMYAATGSTGTTTTSKNITRMARGNFEDISATLSGKVSAEALTALQTLMAKHKTEMDALKTNTGTIVGRITMQAQHTAFKTELDALFVKYPDLRAAMPQREMKHGRGNNKKEAETIIATLSAAAQSEINTIHDTYQIKQETLRSEEKTKIDNVLIQYPDIKAKLDALDTTHTQRGWNKDRKNHLQDENETEDNTILTTTTVK